MKVLFEMLRICQRKDEKCAIFTEYTTTLDVIEMLLKQMDSSDGSKWLPATDYFRLDGSTSDINRQAMIDRFNHQNEIRLRAVLVSSKAGGQGINWWPWAPWKKRSTRDLSSVTKQATSTRVIDMQQIARKFTMADLTKLYE